ncbi:glutamic acid-rich -like isoform X1 [Labeo rohita]|uniref:Glutamic acid-rich-like isoform X1 n=1 Tax=Labeo rohita TaxID=84645 RepID=A0A498LGF2_LABRO|nr:glutamic acid-rich -like isoform X1 [Labeo rohita]
MTSFTKREEERHDNYQRSMYENLQHNKAAWLQGRWLEISEQERRAQIHNQKLLQDFQRAQDTLNDMVARTEAMNTIRVQYEQYLEESFPRWQQRLKDIRVSESKQIKQHLKSYIQQMEEGKGIKAEHRSDFRGHRLSSNSPEPPQPSHTMPNTHQTAKVRLSTNHEESSEGCAVSSEVMVSGVQKRRKKRNGTKSNSTENRNESQDSSAMSQDASDSHSDTKINKPQQKPSKKCNSKESIITEKNVDAVKQDEDEPDESRSQEVSQSSISSEKKDGSEGLNVRQEDDSERDDDSQDIIVAEEKTSHREAEDSEGDDESHDIIVAEEKTSQREVEDEEEDEESADGDEKAGLIGEAQGGDEEESEKVMGKRDETEPSDEPEMEGDVPEDIPDSGDEGETTEEEERDKSFYEKETEKTQGRVEDEREIQNRQDEETDQSNDQHSGSEEENLPQKNHPAATNEIVESDDEFDHFYD